MTLYQFFEHTLTAELPPLLSPSSLLLREMLSPQQHYDWGLRALKTVLRGAGTLLDTERKVQDQKKSEHLLQLHPQSTNGTVCSTTVTAEMEVRIIVQVLRLNTLSKLTYSDSQRFDALVQDVFPGVEFSDVEYERLEEALREASRESSLVVIDRQVRKMPYWSLL